MISAKQSTWGDAKSHTAPELPEAAPAGSYKNTVEFQFQQNTPAEWRVHSEGLNLDGILPHLDYD